MNTASRAILLVALLFGVTSIAVSARQAGPAAAAAENPPMAETVFKNVLVLKGHSRRRVHRHDGDVRRRDGEGLHRLPFA